MSKIVKECETCAHLEKYGGQYPCSECNSDYNKWEKVDETLNAGKINDSGERKSYGENLAEREPSSGKGRFDLVTPFAEERIAKWYELGGVKYADRNWERGGIPFSRYLDSAKRHINKFQKGLDDEDHLAAACWNLMCIIHFQETAKLADRMKSEWDDLPNYMKEARKRMLDAVGVSSV